MSVLGSNYLLLVHYFIYPIPQRTFLSAEASRLLVNLVFLLRYFFFQLKQNLLFLLSLLISPYYLTGCKGNSYSF
jgi:hypothetical protein